MGARDFIPTPDSPQEQNGIAGGIGESENFPATTVSNHGGIVGADAARPRHSTAGEKYSNNFSPAETNSIRLIEANRRKIPQPWQNFGIEGFALFKGHVVSHQCQVTSTIADHFSNIAGVSLVRTTEEIKLSPLSRLVGQ